MSAVSRFQLFCLIHFSQPASDRPFYRLLRKARLRNIVEIGVGDGRRAERMLRLAQRFHAADQIQYTGIDLFESDETAGRLSLKAAHRLLRSTGVRAQLVPGDPLSALRRVANSLSGVELLVISAEHDLDSLRGAWWYVPRMLSRDARIFIEQPGVQKSYRVMERRELDKLAASMQPRRRAA